MTRLTPQELHALRSHWATVLDLVRKLEILTDDAEEGRRIRTRLDLLEERLELLARRLQPVERRRKKCKV